MNKKHPVMKIGQFEFHYIQVPYDDRYYVIKFNKFGNKEIARFGATTVRIIDEMINLAIIKTDGAWNKTRENQCERFFSNKEAYDVYLDKQDEISFNKLKLKEKQKRK